MLWLLCSHIQLCLIIALWYQVNSLVNSADFSQSFDAEVIVEHAIDNPEVTVELLSFHS